MLLCSLWSVDWPRLQPLMDAGELPVLARLVEDGISGPLRAHWPLLESTLSTTAITGRPPDVHGILTGTEIDSVSGVHVPPLASSRQVPAVWDWLEQAGLRTHVIGWPVTHPVIARGGIRVSDRYTRATHRHGAPWPILAGSMAPAEVEGSLVDLRLHPGDLTADALRPFVPRLAEIDQETDRRLVLLAAALAEATSIHAAATWSLEHREWDFAAVHYSLLGSVQRWFGSPEDPIFGGVVRQALRLQDAMLGRLVQLAGPETRIVVMSACGFESSHGVVVIHGPGVPRDELTHGARTIDIAPTVLAAVGIEKPAEMPGRNLLDGIAEKRTVVRAEPMAAQDAPALGIEDAAEWLEKLGYTDAMAAPLAAASAQLEMDRAFHLAVYRMGSGATAQAIPELERCAGSHDIAGLLLAYAYFDTGRLDDCERALRGIAGEPKLRAGALLLEGRLLLRRGRKREALALLEDAGEETSPLLSSPMLAWLRGEVYRSLGRLTEAEACYQRAVEGDPYLAPAHVGLATIYLVENRNQEAAEAALRATAIDYGHADSHFLLALASTALGDRRMAQVALEACLKLDAEHRGAQRLSAALARRGPRRA